jgi:hypothetical protein
VNRWTGPIRLRATTAAKRHPRFADYLARARKVVGDLEYQVKAGGLGFGSRRMRIADDAFVQVSINRVPNCEHCPPQIIVALHVDPGVVETTPAPSFAGVHLFGIGGLRGQDPARGVFTRTDGREVHPASPFRVEGLEGRVTKATLVWHALTGLRYWQSVFPYNTVSSDANKVTLNGVEVVGEVLQLASDNCWNWARSSTHIADVTDIVSGDGEYLFADYSGDLPPHETLSNVGYEQDVNGTLLLVETEQAAGFQVQTWFGNVSTTEGYVDDNWVFGSHGAPLLGTEGATLTGVPSANASIAIVCCDGQEFSDNDAGYLNNNIIVRPFSYQNDITGRRREFLDWRYGSDLSWIDNELPYYMWAGMFGIQLPDRFPQDTFSQDELSAHNMWSGLLTDVHYFDAAQFSDGSGNFTFTYHGADDPTWHSDCVSCIAMIAVAEN